MHMIQRLQADVIHEKGEVKSCPESVFWTGNGLILALLYQALQSFRRVNHLRQLLRYPDIEVITHLVRGRAIELLLIIMDHELMTL
ncbi:hypothetical protein N7449_010014 [Penicillium cf. viridicatum]|uniref:Uncharacterized protein n=1 Tax=Penicillium cf. viridicatum TaxID=2972119 RepID=A0A9W9J267_9EURO|nr:hypothetical protein N7449_010014 [Penicillium cf. viridicatum]